MQHVHYRRNYFCMIYTILLWTVKTEINKTPEGFDLEKTVKFYESRSVVQLLYIHV